MIARVWKGTPREGRTEDYLAHLRDAVVPELARIAGFRGAEVLRRLERRQSAGSATASAVPDGEGEVVVITKWDSMDAIVQFAGTDPSVAVVAEGARQVLARWDAHVTHYEVVAIDEESARADAETGTGGVR